MRIDLHSHSSMSDGTQQPDELVHHARTVGIDVLALTDHDTVDGWPAAVAAAADAGVVVVPGIEISTRRDGAGVHLLAYLPDPTYPPLADELVRIRADRTSRLRRIVAKLSGVGVELTMDDVVAVSGSAATVGRPHVADALVQRGYATDRRDAFTRWLAEGGPAYVPKYSPSIIDAIAMVRAAGGAAVLAHPWGRASRRMVPPEIIVDLASAGLAGLEVDHQDHDEELRRALRRLAADLDLVVTGSSDYHGAGKTGHELGVNTTVPAEYERLLQRCRAAAVDANRDVPVPAGSIR